MALSHPDRLLSNTVWSGMGRALTIAIGLILTPYILGKVGPAGFGLWALANLLIGYLSLADLGIQASLVRQIAHALPDQSPERTREIVSTSFLFYLGLFVLCCPASIAFGPMLTPLFAVPAELTADAEFVFAFVLASLFLSIALGVMGSILPAIQRMDISNKILIVTSLINLGAMISVLEAGWGVPGLVITALAVKALSAALQWIWAKRLLPQLRISRADFRWAVWRELFSFGWKVQVSRLSELLTFGFDRLFLGMFGGVAALGRYQPAVQAATQARLAPHVLVLSALPYASELSALKDGQALRSLYLRGTLYLAFTSFLLLGFLMAAASIVTRLWLGPEYEEVGEWIRILCIGVAINAPLSLGGLVSQAIGRPGLQARSSLMATALNIVLAPLGFWLAGISGLAAGATVALGAASIWFYSRLHRVLQLDNWLVFRQCFLMAAVYLLLPAAVIGVSLDILVGYPVSTGTAVRSLGLSAAGFLICASVGAARLDLWRIRKHFSEAAPSGAAGSFRPGESGRDSLK